jgi:hypothetical protein
MRLARTSKDERERMGRLGAAVVLVRTGVVLDPAFVDEVVISESALAYPQIVCRARTSDGHRIECCLSFIEGFDREALVRYVRHGAPA